MRSEAGLNVAVVGATGAVGAEFLKLVERRPFPIRGVRLFASEKSAARKIDVLGHPVAVESIDGASLAGIDLAFFSAGASVSRGYAARFVDAGCVVIDNSSAFRMDPEVPLVVPEINLEAIPKRPGIIANPNCSTIILLMALHPLHRISPVESVVASTYQAVSGAGARAIDELDRQVRALVSPGGGAGVASKSIRSLKPAVFPHPIAFNLIPKISDLVADGFTQEEMKMQNETRKILASPQIRVSATCVRVPVLRAHSISARVVTTKKIRVDEARAAFARAPGLKLLDDPAREIYPTPIAASESEAVLVGRLRDDATSDRGLLFWVVGDQILKGAALNGMQIAQALVAMDRVGGPGRVS